MFGWLCFDIGRVQIRRHELYESTFVLTAYISGCGLLFHKLINVDLRIAFFPYNNPLL